jgi:hypothetical protein
MPKENDRIWELARFSPNFMGVMFLLMMYSCFVAKFGGRNHHLMRLNISPILPQLLTIMSDTQSFPFFSRCNLLKMSAFHGAALHLVDAFYGPITSCNFKNYLRIRTHILRRVLSGIVSKPEIVSCFEICSSALQMYPGSIPRSLLHVELCDWKFSFDTIFNILSLCTIFPEPNAILNISSAKLSDDQMSTYNKLCMIIIFRRLFETRNKVFMLLCKYLHTSDKYYAEGKFQECRRLRKKYEKILSELSNSHDFEVYVHYFRYLVFQVLHPATHIQSLFDDSYIVLLKFYNMMKHVSISTVECQGPWRYNMRVHTHDFLSLCRILNEKNEETLLTQLSMNPMPPPPQNERTLSFCMIPVVLSSRMWLFQLLKNANRFNLPPELGICLKNILFDMENVVSCSYKIKSRWIRLMVILVGFVEMVKSRHPQKHCIFDYVSSMNETGNPNQHLEIFLDLSLFQDDSKKWVYFHDVFKQFLKYTTPGHSEPTARKLLSFFEKMHRIFSNERFLRIFQEFIQEFLKEINDKSHLRSCPRFVCNSFLDKLSENPEFCWMVRGICYFHRTNCAYCLKRLDYRNDSGLCNFCLRDGLKYSSSDDYSD